MALAELVCWHFDKQGFRVSQTADGEEAMLIARLGQVTLAQIAADFDQRYAALLATGAIEPLTGH